MNYTRQQLMGGAGYSKGVRLGNWNEDEALEETKQREFLLRKSRGELLVDRLSARRAKLLAPVASQPLRPDSDIHFGDAVVVAHVATRSAIAALPDTVVDAPTGDVAVSAAHLADAPSPSSSSSSAEAAAPVAAACARTAIVITACHPASRTLSLPTATAGLSPDPLTATRRTLQSSRAVLGAAGGAAEASQHVLHYGQYFHLCTHPALLADDSGAMRPPLYLASHTLETYTSRRASMSGFQQVCLSATPDANTVWFARPLSPVDEGRPVRAGDRIIIVHKATNQALAVDARHVTPNDFGRELEVYAHSHKSPGRPVAMTSELGELGMPPALSTENHFSILVGAPDSHATRASADLRDPTADDVLLGVRRGLAARGPFALRSLARTLRVLDTKGSGALEAVDIVHAMREAGVRLAQHQADTLCSFFEDGLRVRYEPLLQALRGSMSPARRAAVDAAYRAVSSAVAGPTTGVTVGLLERLFDASCHPEVAAGTKPARSALAEFLMHWAPKQREAGVSGAEFAEFYADVSACTERDADFVRAVCTAWHVPARELQTPPAAGAGSAPPSVRAKVTLHSGLVTEESILLSDLPAVDVRSVRALLEKRGVSNIRVVELL